MVMVFYSNLFHLALFQNREKQVLCSQSMGQNFIVLTLLRNIVYVVLYVIMNDAIWFNLLHFSIARNFSSVNGSLVAH